MALLEELEDFRTRPIEKHPRSVQPNASIPAPDASRNFATIAVVDWRNRLEDSHGRALWAFRTVSVAPGARDCAHGRRSFRKGHCRR
jgi:hypothetical protein